MKKPTRTFLFLLFVLVFIIVTPVVLAYSQGYRIDWGRKMIVPTGALFLAPRPAPVEISLDGKIRKVSSTLFQNVFIGNLIPQSYLVRISKSGYHTWQKNLSVSSRLVTEAKNILLIPKNPTLREIATNVRDFHASPSGKYLLIVQDSKHPEMYLFQLESGAFQLLFNGLDEFSNFQVSSVQWNEDSTKVLFALEKKLKKQWMVLDIRDGLPPEALDLSSELENAKLSFTVGSVLFSIKDESLYLLSEKNNLFTKIADHIKDASPSSDGKKLLLEGTDGTFVYWLHDVHVQPFHDKGDLIGITNAGDIVNDAIWLTKDNEHIIVAAKDSLYITELDDRDTRNVHEIAKKSAQRLFYQEESHSLYFLSRPTLYSVSLK